MYNTMNINKSLFLLFVITSLFLVKEARASVIPADTSCHAVYYTTIQTLHVPCIDIQTPTGTATWGIILQITSNFSPLQFSINSALQRSPVVNENTDALVCHARYYPETGQLDLPCLLARDQAGNILPQIYQGKMQQVAMPILPFVGFIVSELAVKEQASATQTPKNSPVLFSPVNNTQQQTLPFEFSWSMNNDMASILDVKLTVSETTGLNAAIGSSFCVVKGIGKTTNYSANSCGNFKANQWYIWEVALTFVDGSTQTTAQAYFKTAAISTPPTVINSTVDISFSGSGSGTVTVSPLNTSCLYLPPNARCQPIVFTGTINLSATTDAGMIFSGWTGACSGSSTICTLTADASTKTIAVGATFKKESHVILLLHGMNTNETTWNDYVRLEPAFAANCQTITAGVISGGVQLTSTPPALGCYRLRFGSFDATSGRRGLENLSASGPQGGDFSTFEQLGQEVDLAVTAIMNAYGNQYGDNSAVKIALLGHSRGGLAARAFLQSNAVTKQNIVALLTTGTPHQGSPLGRVYQYMKNNCSYANGSRKVNYSWFGLVAADDCTNDWQVVDTLKNGTCRGADVPFSDETLDIRRPTVDDLSDLSNAITELNSSNYKLPTTVRFAALNYTGISLGKMTTKYNIFPDTPDSVGSIIGSLCDQVSYTAQAAILGAHLPTEADLIGDGIVPSVNQNFPVGVSVTVLRDNPRNTAASPILHTAEPTRHLYLSQALDDLLPAWGLQ